MKKSIFLFFAAILCAIGMNAATPEKLYLTPNSNWNEGNARFAAYFFGNGEKWVSMTKVTGETNLYEVTTPAGYPNVIFCRMNPNASANNWNNKWNQTGDLTIPTNGNNHFTVPNGSWDGATTTWSIWPIPAEKTYKDITFTITASSAPQIHYWDGGDKMVGSVWENLPTMSETAAGSGVYTYTVEDVDEFTGVKYLFKIGDLQTADQTTSVDVTANLKDFFPKVAVMGVNNWDGTDVMTVADDYLSASITLPLTAKKYDLKLTVDGEWKGHKDQNHITRANNSSVFKENDGNGSIDADYAGNYVFTYTYANQTLTVTYPELPAVKTYKDIVITVVANVTPKIHYWDGGDKVVATDWETKPDMVATGAANTYSYTIKDVDEALGVKYIIVAGTAQTEDLHTTVDVTANFKDLLPAVEVMGINGWNAGEGIPMTIAEDYSASATINFTEAKTQEFKLTVGGAWKGHSDNNKITRANNSSAFTEDSGNASVKVDVAGDYVFTYTYSDKKLTVTYPASDEPIVPHYYIAGTQNLTGFDWQVDGLEIAKDGDVYKHTFSEKNADIYEFKITDGTWTNQWGFSNLAANYVGVEQGKDGEGNPNGNIKIVTEEAKNITVIFDPANNEITLENWAEAAPATVTYVLMGVNGDWTTGIEMDVNPDNDKEYIRTCQAISATDAVKVVKLEDGEQVAWYGSVKDGIEVTVTYDDMGNIQLPEGYYNFYFDSSLEDKQLWIAAATDCETEPEYNVVEDVITNFVFDTEAWPMVCAGGPSTTYQVEVFLTLTEDADGTLAYEDCSVSIMGTDATFIDGTLSNIDPFAPYADAVLHVQWDGDYYELQLAMSSTPAEAMTIEAEDATVTLTEYPTNFEETEFAYELVMVANWDNEAESLSYTVEFVIPTFDPTAASGEYNANFYVTGEGNAAGMNENVLVTVTKDGNNVTLTGNVSALNGNAYNVTISGTLPTETPDYTRTVTLNQWGTICLPNASSSFTGATFYEVSSLDPAKGLWLDQLPAGAQLVAGKPYIFYATATEITVTYTDAAPVQNPVEGTNGLTGTFTEIAANGVLVDNYVIAQNKVWVAGTGATLPANCAYINAEQVPTETQAEIPGRRRVCMGENAATSLDQIVAPEGQAVKAIVNGQLIIIRDGVNYNVQGQKL